MRKTRKEPPKRNTNQPPKEKGYAQYRSVDGETYKFETNDPATGTRHDYADQMGLYCALTEIAKGGDVGVVLEAFKVTITDVNGKKLKF